jgi:hypothetical protein
MQYFLCLQNGHCDGWLGKIMLLLGKKDDTLELGKSSLILCSRTNLFIPCIYSHFQLILVFFSLWSGRSQVVNVLLLVSRI